MNAWSDISISSAATAEPRRASFRRPHITVVIGSAAVAAAVLGLVPGNSSSSATFQVTPVAKVPAAAPRMPAVAEAAAVHASPEAATARFTGRIGTDLTRSLQSAGVPETHGREYVAVLARTFDLNGGLSVEDRFDLVILRENGRLGELAYAGLDRVGRADLQLMKWTDGKEVRWVDADGIDPSARRGMEIPVAGRVSSGFGERFHPVLGSRRMHSGVDVAASLGAPIVAAADGRVISAGWRGGYGRQVAIQHAEGVKTTYSHMSRIAAAPGARVSQGQVIGYVGSSGLSTGPHLHYEVYKAGRRVNPLSVELARSPLKDEELYAFRSRLRGLLLGGA